MCAVKQRIRGKKGFLGLLMAMPKITYGTWMKHEYFLKPHLIVVLMQRGRNVREER